MSAIDDVADRASAVDADETVRRDDEWRAAEQAACDEQYERTRIGEQPTSPATDTLILYDETEPEDWLVADHPMPNEDAVAERHYSCAVCRAPIPETAVAWAERDDPRCPQCDPFGGSK